MKYRLIAVGRLPDGKIELLCGDVRYESDEDSCWQDLNDIFDDEELPEPEPIQQVMAGAEESGAAADMVEEILSETYGPLVGKLARNGLVGGTAWIKKRFR